MDLRSGPSAAVVRLGVLPALGAAALMGLGTLTKTGAPTLIPEALSWPAVLVVGVVGGTGSNLATASNWLWGILAWVQMVGLAWPWHRWLNDRHSRRRKLFAVWVAVGYGVSVVLAWFGFAWLLVGSLVGRV